MFGKTWVQYDGFIVKDNRESIALAVEPKLENATWIPKSQIGYIQYKCITEERTGKDGKTQTVYKYGFETKDVFVKKRIQQLQISDWLARKLGWA